MRSSTGFALMEVIVATFVLGLTIAIVFTQISTARQKAILTTERDRLLKAITYAQQQSIAAYRGNQFSVAFTPPNNYVIQPENSQFKLRTPLHYLDPDFNQSVTFSKLTGRTDKDITISLVSGHLITSIIITESGSITTTPITKNE